MSKKILLSAIVLAILCSLIMPSIMAKYYVTLPYTVFNSATATYKQLDKVYSTGWRVKATSYLLNGTSGPVGYGAKLVLCNSSSPTQQLMIAWKASKLVDISYTADGSTWVYVATNMQIKAQTGEELWFSYDGKVFNVGNSTNSKVYVEKFAFGEKFPISYVGGVGATGTVDSGYLYVEVELRSSMDIGELTEMLQPLLYAIVTITIVCGIIAWMGKVLDKF